MIVYHGSIVTVAYPDVQYLDYKVLAQILQETEPELFEKNKELSRQG